MKMNKVEAPVMGVYEVQNCPNCGVTPCVNVSVESKDGVTSIDYKVKAEVYCSCCGLSAPSVELWNVLSCK